MTNHGFVTSSEIEPLTDKDKEEVLFFLSRRPIHTVFMAGLIGDNGIVSPRNRGTFYGCRNEQGHLRGVALIGQKCFIEAQDNSVLTAFAHTAQRNPNAHLHRGEQKQVEFLLTQYADTGRVPQVVSRELLLEQVAAADGVDSEPDLRLANSDDLEFIMSINASMVYEESGVDPRTIDYKGMSERLAYRIAQGRCWVLVENGQVIFKADVISLTPITAFVEGVYVSPQQRGKGHGVRCMTQFARNLLMHVSSICLVVDEENQPARALYERVGYRLGSPYATAYFSAI